VPVFVQLMLKLQFLSMLACTEGAGGTWSKSSLYDIHRVPTITKLEGIRECYNFDFQINR